MPGKGSEWCTGSPGRCGWRCQNQQGYPTGSEEPKHLQMAGSRELGGRVCQRASLLDVVTDKRSQKKAGIKEGQTKYCIFQGFSSCLDGYFKFLIVQSEIFLSQKAFFWSSFLNMVCVSLN